MDTKIVFQSLSKSKISAPLLYLRSFHACLGKNKGIELYMPVLEFLGLKVSGGTVDSISNYLI